MNNRNCLQCYEQLRGRADQKFCGDQCRSAYNNQQNILQNAVISSINRILKKNYSILSNLKANGKTTVYKSDLERNGYCFEYFTFTSVSRNSKVKFFCYDYGYREKEHDKVILVQRNLNDELTGLRA